MIVLWQLGALLGNSHVLPFVQVQSYILIVFITMLIALKSLN